MRVLKADKRRDILHLLIEGNSIRSTERLTRVHRDTIDRPAGLWASAKAAGYGIFKRCLDVIVSQALLIIAAPASALPLSSARSRIWSSTAQQPVGLERCMVERESSALDARDAIKRVIDVLGASLLIALFAPLMALIALIVKLSSPGPAIFRHRCLGLGGREYVCYKFRTMVVNADELLLNSPELRTRFDKDFKLKDDPRLTPFGALIRKASLDELPQLFNVLNGTMSLIGPRPIVPRERARYGSEAAEQLFSVKPGLGGVWQVCGRSDTPYEQRIAMDMLYIINRSTFMDLKLMFLTAIVVIRGRGAY
jgi:lipopolysaccharide/colanic/teichoic acid biosynthesis glycosyltransferase